MSRTQPGIRRRAFLRTAVLGTAIAAVSSPLSTLAAHASDALTQLGRRIKELYPARSTRLSSEPLPKTWPHLSWRKPEQMLTVDGWLLPISIAQVALQDASED